SILAVCVRCRTRSRSVSTRSRSPPARPGPCGSRRSATTRSRGSNLAERALRERGALLVLGDGREAVALVQRRERALDRVEAQVQLLGDDPVGGGGRVPVLAHRAGEGV